MLFERLLESPVFRGVITLIESLRFRRKSTVGRLDDGKGCNNFLQFHFLVILLAAANSDKFTTSV